MNGLNEQTIMPVLAAIIIFLAGLLIGRLRKTGADPAQAARLQECETSLHSANMFAARLEEQVGHHQLLHSESLAEISRIQDRNATLQLRCVQVETDLASASAGLLAAERRYDEFDAQQKAAHRELQDRAVRLEAELAESRIRAGSAAVEVARLTMQLSKEQEGAEEKVALLTAVRSDMETRFRQIATESLRQNGEELQKTSKERLEAALAPLKQHVDQFQQELKHVHEGALKDRASLRTEIEALTKRSEDVSREALALTRALKGDKQRQGAWGEMILGSILEKSGLRKDEEYHVQEHRQSDDGERYRPDVVVRMPGGNTLVIDAKVSLNDYETCVNSDDEAECIAARLRHVASIRRHITGLSVKAYQSLEAASVDYVVMFIPIEGALSEALRSSGEITAFALEKNIMIATPTTLMMALRTVASVWTIERRNQNAEDIANRAGKIYDKVVAFTESMTAVGKGLNNAQSSFDEAMGRLTRGGGNLLGQVEKLKQLGARSTKSIKVDFAEEYDLAESGEGLSANVIVLPLADQSSE